MDSERLNKIVCRLALLTGFILRVAQFLYNRSLTEGEAPLAMNIIERTFGAITKILDYNQAAPVGFLMIEKAVTLILGTGEMALRFFPLIGSIAALYLFYRLAGQVMDNAGTAFAVILFAAGDHLIYFASEVKPYSTDVAVALIITLLGYYLLKSAPSWRSALIFALITSLGFWFSFPAVFIWAGFALITLFRYAKRSFSWHNLVIALLLPALSILVYYLISLRHIAGQESLTGVWQSAFMPFPPRSFADLKWFVFVLVRMFKFPVGFSTYELSLALLCFLIGIIAWVKNRKMVLLMLILPILITMCASGFAVYPFEGRLLLFLTPALILVVSRGLFHIYQSLRIKSVISAYALLAIFFLLPVGNAAYRVIRPRAPEELRPGLEYILKNQQPGDIVYVYYASANAFKYYTYIKGQIPDHCIGIEARSDWSDYYNDLIRLRGNKRVWVIMSHIARTFGVDEEKLFLNYLNQLGRPIEYIRFPGAAIFLYDLSMSPTQSASPF